MSDTAAELEAYLHANIPLSRHMDLRVRSATRDRLELALPLAPNVNPHGTVFGGALAATGLVGGWMLLHAAFTRAGLSIQLVGKEGRCEFLAPGTADCVAITTCPTADLDALLARFAERGRARQELLTVIRIGEVEVARHHGVYTALPAHTAAASAA
ncbi:MAG: YiiD C-terminal domain-containing protein [Panacagrimonas sp.]